MSGLDADARAELFARVRAADTALAVARAVEVVPWRFGRAVFDPAYGRSYENNRLLVEEPLDGAATADLVGAADALMEPRGLTHRRVDNLEPLDDARLRPGFEAAGWRREDSTWMVAVRPPDRPAAAGLAREVSWEELRATVETSTAREPYATDPEVVRQLVDRMERLQAAATVRHFAVRAPDGDGSGGRGFAAYCHLFLGAAPGCACVEEVATLEEWRGRGFARSVVLAAVDAARAAGADCTWLYADEDDWPKELYRKLGFDSVGRTITWTRWG
jgi:ribosomal protein S18 acetylase RimI-like enzyme